MAPAGSYHVTVDMNAAEMKAFTSWQGPLGRSLARLASMTVRFAKLDAPKKTGHLMGSIKYKKLSGPGGITFEAGSNARHALWMEKGTRPHLITPKKPGGMLVFFWPKMGKTVHLKSVNHPGTKAYRFMEKGFDKAWAIWKATG